MHDVVLPQILQGQNDLCNVKPRIIFVQGPVNLQNVCEVPSDHVFLHKAVVVIVGKRVESLDDKVASNDFEDVSLSLQRLKRLIRTIDDLDCIQILRADLSGKNHPTERSLPKRLYELKVL